MNPHLDPAKSGLIQVGLREWFLERETVVGPNSPDAFR